MSLIYLKAPKTTHKDVLTYVLNKLSAAVPNDLKLESKNTIYEKLDLLLKFLAEKIALLPSDFLDSDDLIDMLLLLVEDIDSYDERSNLLLQVLRVVYLSNSNVENKVLNFGKVLCLNKNDKETQIKIIYFPLRICCETKRGDLVKQSLSDLLNTDFDTNQFFEAQSALYYASCISHQMTRKNQFDHYQDKFHKKYLKLASDYFKNDESEMTGNMANVFYSNLYVVAKNAVSDWIRCGKSADLTLFKLVETAAENMTSLPVKEKLAKMSDFLSIISSGDYNALFSFKMENKTFFTDLNANGDGCLKKFRLMSLGDMSKRADESGRVSFDSVKKEFLIMNDNDVEIMAIKGIKNGYLKARIDPIDRFLIFPVGEESSEEQSLMDIEANLRKLRSSISETVAPLSNAFTKF
ncbi:hypothetical protein MHBO_000177 [Bonamia ostreae]|uniref:Uncharacterized protein n=1 Tax=Bonamia ostreae TaxID=126728 RepID=A0ABV2AER4_9EUKA